MFYVRPVAERDLGDLLRLAGQAKSGLTTLPPDEAVLSRRIERSLESFKRHVDRPGSEDYLFVLYDDETQQVCGTSGVVAKVGGYEAFYTYKLEDEEFHSKQLEKHFTRKVLKLQREHDGPSELCSLFLSPLYRKKGAGRLLSLSRFLFIAAFRDRFEQDVIAELRGYFNDEGRSPFWDAVTSKFIDIPFEAADYLVMRDKHFIEDLMPKHPLYVDLLPQYVQDLLGEVHPNTRPALALLESQGLSKTEHIDIFEAGPVVRATCDNVYTINSSRCYPVREIRGQISGAAWLLSNEREDYVCCMDAAWIESGEVCISTSAADVLGVGVGENIRISRLYPQ